VKSWVDPREWGLRDTGLVAWGESCITQFPVGIVVTPPQLRPPCHLNRCTVCVFIGTRFRVCCTRIQFHCLRTHRFPRCLWRVSCLGAIIFHVLFVHFLAYYLRSILILVSYSRPRFPVSLQRLCCDVCRYRSWRFWVPMRRRCVGAT